MYDRTLALPFHKSFIHGMNENYWNGMNVWNEINGRNIMDGKSERHEVQF